MLYEQQCEEFVQLKLSPVSIFASIVSRKSSHNTRSKQSLTETPHISHSCTFTPGIPCWKSTTQGLGIKIEINRVQ